MVADCHAFRCDRDRLLLQLVRGVARMGPLAASADSAPVNVLAQSGHSPQGNDDEQDTNDCDTAPVIDPPHIADHETAGGPIYVPQTLPGEENSCRADKHADKQQQHLHFIPL